MTSLQSVEDVFMRPFNEEDAAIIYKWYHDPRLAPFFRRYIGGLSLEQCKQATRFLKSHILVALQPSTGFYIGMVTFLDSDPILRNYLMGALIDPQFQKCGYAQFLPMALKWAFEVMNANRVGVEILNENERLCKITEQAGLLFEGLRRQSCFFDNRLHDEALYSLTREDYKNLKK